MITFKEFQTQRDFKAVMSGGTSNGLDGYHNYMGPDFAGWLCGPMVTRDSDTMDESNFETALERLGRKSKNVQVQRCSHWACGWFNRILVKRGTPEAKKLYKIYEDLDAYPILDEMDHSEREFESFSRYASSESKHLAKSLVQHFGVKFSSKLCNIAYELNMSVQYSSGPDACINIYHVREPDERDLIDLKRALSDIAHLYKTSKPFIQLKEAIEKRLSRLN